MIEVVNGTGKIMDISDTRESKKGHKYYIIRFKKEEKKNGFDEIINLFCWESVTGLTERITKIINSDWRNKRYFFYAEVNEDGFYSCKTIFDVSGNNDLNKFMEEQKERKQT